MAEQRTTNASACELGQRRARLFNVTADLTQWTNAAFLSKVGKRTPVFVRFNRGGRTGQRRHGARPVRDVLDDAERDRTVSNIVGHAAQDVSDDVKARMIGYWTRVDANLGARVAAGPWLRRG
jgi:catalase